MKRNNLSLILILSFAFIFFVTISNLDFDSDEKNKKDINIVTSFYPIYVMTKNITNGIENVNVSNMTDFHAGCPHDYTLTPSDMKKIEESTIFIINGAGIETFLSDIIEDKNLNIIDSSDDVSVIQEEDEINSHIWTDPLRHIIQVENITDALIEIDVKNEKKYKENSVKYIDKLLKLNDSKKELRKYTGNIIMFHESLEYFLDDLNLDVVYTVHMDHDEALSANEITNIITKIKENNIKVIFVEKQFDNNIITTIQTEVDVDFYELDTGATGDGSLDSYIDSMNYNINTLKEAFE